MTSKDWLDRFWSDVAAQDADRLAVYFAMGARIRWHNTNECFTVAEYIQANCTYPGEWEGAVERIEECNGVIISVAHIWLKNQSASFHVTSFFSLLDGFIVSLDEYWGDDGKAPQWRSEMHLGTPIQ